mgnify:CR=1 FL=1
MPPRRASVLIALLAAGSLGLAGCSLLIPSGGPAASPTASAPAESGAAPADEPEVEAAEGLEISGTGYSYRVPDGWGLPPEGVYEGIPGSEAIDTAAFDLVGVDDGFADNINVIPLGVEASAETFETQAAPQLEAQGATDITVEDRVSFGGAESAPVTASWAQGDATYLPDQFSMSGEGETFSVTFSFGPTATEDQRASVYEAVLASWTWE